MDILFDPLKWQQTKLPEPGDTQMSPTIISCLCLKLNEQAKDIIQRPYDPNGWLQRSVTLSKLRYPELAVGDAYKAKVLCHTHLSRLHKRSGWSLGHRMGFWVYDEGCHDDEREEREQKLIVALEKLQKRCQRAILENTAPNFLDDLEGRIHLRPYPWMRETHLTRSDELVQSINQEFASKCATVSGDGTSCVLKRHAFGEGVGRADTSDLLGVFAARNIAADEDLFIDTTKIWGCNGPGSNGDRGNLHGGIGCGDPLHPNAGSDDTSLDLRWIRDKAGRHAALVLRNCKLLLCSIQDGVEQPLDHPLIARMTPRHAKDEVHKFSLSHDIAIPNEALQQFGVDIFANANYDTWVLFTVDSRAINNSCGTPTVELLNPLFTLFNHSCDPNVDWKIADDHQSVALRACQAIRQGEQMFVMYDGYLEKKPLEERRKVLWDWLDGPCQCTRCVSEEKLQRKDSVSSAVPEWDSSDKPVFPEDLPTLKN